MRAWCFLVVSLAAIAGAGCSSSSQGASLAAGCVVNSDCASGLFCVFGHCHQQCNTSVDCTTGARCVASGTSATHICELSVEATCTGGINCPGNLLCNPVDFQCRMPCTQEADCTSGQVCATSGSQTACYQGSNSVDRGPLIDAGVLTADGSLETVAPDATVAVGGGTQGGAEAGSETGAQDGGDASSEATGPTSGDGSTDGTMTASDAGDGGSTIAVNSCPTAQTQFGPVVTGDSNPGFTTAVGLRGATQMWIFSGYTGPAVDAGAEAAAASVSSVFMQAFDPTSGASAGPSQQLFQTNLTGAIDVVAGAVAPTGDIALIYSSSGSGNPVGGNLFGLWAAFLSPGADGGAGGMQLRGTPVGLEIDTNALVSEPVAFWSPVGQAFLFSWRHQPQNDVRVVKYRVNGASASGGIDSLPTTGGNQLYGGPWSGAAGSLFAESYINTVNYFADMTVFDQAGQVVGSPFTAGSSAVGSEHWTVIGGTAQGFTLFWDNGSSVSESLVPLPSPGGANVFSPDAGDGGPLPGFTFPGNQQAVFARAMNDTAGGAGGVGLALQYTDHVAFAYVSADGLTHTNPLEVFPHAQTAGENSWGVNVDLMSLGNFGGSFVVGMYSSAAHSTQIAATGCGP